jgi:DegV family protein with EDD domain
MTAGRLEIISLDKPNKSGIIPSILFLGYKEGKIMIELITDSTSDLSPELARQLGVRVLPLTVLFGQESFRDGVDITHSEFYRRLRGADTLPTTTQINPEVFLSVFQQVLDRGNQAVCILIASELSGTCQSALIAKEELGSDDIFVVDSRAVTFSLGLLVAEAARLRDQGLTAEQIVRELESLRERVRLYAVADTLKYLKMGGRISAATAVVGGALGIQPIIRVQDGKVEAVGKVRGRKAGFRWVRERLLSDGPDLSRPIALGHADCPEILDELAASISEVTDSFSSVSRGIIGATVGTHIGPGTVGFAFFVKQA